MARYIQGQDFWQSQKMWPSTHTSPPKQGLIVVTVWKFLLKMEASLFYKVAYAIVELLCLKKFFLIFELKCVCYNVYLLVKVLWPLPPSFQHRQNFKSVTLCPFYPVNLVNFIWNILISISLFVCDIFKPSLSSKLLFVSILQMWHSGLNTTLHIWLNTNYGRKGETDFTSQLRNKWTHKYQ